MYISEKGHLVTEAKDNQFYIKNTCRYCQLPTTKVVGL